MTKTATSTLTAVAMTFLLLMQVAAPIAGAIVQDPPPMPVPSFAPASASADVMATPQPVRLTIPAGSTAAYDRIVIQRAPGFTFDVRGPILVGTTPYVNRNDSIFGDGDPQACIYTNPADYTGFVTRDAYFFCSDATYSNITFSKPIAAEAQIELFGFTGPTQSGNHTFRISLYYTASGADAVPPALAPRAPLSIMQGMARSLDFVVLPGALHDVTFTQEHATTDAVTPRTFAAVARDRFTNVIPLTPLTYAVATGSGEIGAASGVYTPDKVGMTTITVTTGSKSNTTSIEVTLGPLDHVEFTTPLLSTDADTPVTFSAISHDARHNLRADPIAYSILSGPGTIDAATGVYTPDETGTSIIQAQAEDKTATTTLDILPGSIDAVVIDQACLAVDADTPCDFDAHVEDANQNTIPASVSWSIVSGPGAIDGQTGVFTPDLVGLTVVRASAGDATTDSTIETTPGALDHVAFTALAAATTADTPIDFEAEARDQHENAREDVITYSLGGSGAVDPATGVFTPDKVGTSTVTATAGTESVSQAVTVTPGALFEVVYTAKPSITQADRAVTFAAVARDANENLRDDAITFAVADGTGRFEADGLFVPDQVGSVTIRASAADKHADTIIEVIVGTVETVVFTQSFATTDADTARTFIAEARDVNENVIADADIIYEIASGSGAIGAASGVFTPDKVGLTRIRASAEGVTANATIQVTEGALASVAFTLAPASTDADTPVQFDAEAYDANGNVLDESIAYAVVTGSGAIDASGLFTPDAAVETTLRASAGSFDDVTVVDVTPGALHHVTFVAAPATTTADDAVTFTAEARDAADNARADVVTYTLSGSGDLDALTGLFTPELVGTHTVTANAGEMAATADILVTQGALDHLTWTNQPPSTDADTPVTFVATARDQHENLRNDAITYSLTGSGAIDAATGLFTPDKAGNVVIAATADTVTLNAVIGVVPGALDHITLAGATQLTADETATYVGTAYDANDNERADALTYGVIGGTGTIDASGVFTPDKVGSVLLEARHGDVSGDLQVVVTEGVLDHVTFVLAPATTDADTTQLFEAEARDANENVLADTVTYSVSSGTGSIDASGIFTPERIGPNVVVASAGAESASTTVHVTVGAAHHLAFTTAPEATNADLEAPFVAKVFDQNENARTDAVTYSLASGSGEVDAQTGVFTPDREGISVIRATSGSFTQDASISVGDGALALLVFVDPASSTDADTPVTFVARTYDAHGNERPDTVTYELVSGSGAMDASTGVFTPNQVGTVTLRASSDGFADETTLTVGVGALHHVTFTTSPTSTDADTPVVFSAEARDAKENTRPDVVAFEVDGSGAIDASGTFTPALAGTQTIVATSGDKSESVDIDVTPGACADVTFTQAPAETTADAPVTFAAVCSDAQGNVRDDVVRFSLQSGTGAIGEVTGTFTPDKVGTVVVQATMLTHTDTASILVTPGALAAVVFTTTHATTDADTPVTFAAQALDANENARSDAITWSLAAGTGTVDAATGVFTPDQVGTAAILATAGPGIDATEQIVVTVGALDHVAFSAAPATTTADDAVTFLARPYDANGNERTDAVAYSILSGPGSIGGTSGRFTPELVGLTTIQATAGTETSSATIETTVGALDHVAFTLAPAATDADTTQTFAAEAYDRHGNLRPDVPVFSVTSGSGAIDGAGVFTPGLVGSVTIRASVGDVVDSTTITVSPGAATTVSFTAAPTTTTATQPVDFHAAVYDHNGNLRSDDVAYEILTGSGSVGAASGRFTPDLVGATVIRATSGALFADASIDVDVGPLDHVAFTLAPATTDADTTASFAAASYDVNGNARGDPITYSLASGTGSVDAATGVFTPQMTGTGVVRATAGDVFATTDIVVTVGALHHVTFTQAPASTDADTPASFVAQARDQHENVRPDAVTYALTGSGAIDAATGVFTPELVGTQTITAAVGTVTKDAAIEVAPGALDHVLFTTAPSTTDADSPQTFAASPYDQHGNLRTDTVGYAVSAGSGLVDAQSGLFTPELVGTTTIVATAGARNAETAILVTFGALDHVTLVDAPSATDADTVVSFVAEGRDQFDNARDDVVAWSVLGSGAIDAAGDYTPELVGSHTVRATVGAFHDDATISVTPGAAVSLHRNTTASTAVAGEDFRVSFALRDQHGNLAVPSTNAVTLAIASGPLTGVLSGDVTNAAANGYVEFPTVSLNKVGDYTLSATAPGLTEAATGTIVITVAALDHFDVVCDSPITAGSSSACVAQAQDAFDNDRVDAPSTWSSPSGWFTPTSGTSTTFHPPNAAGSYVATASLSGVIGSAAVVVGAGDIATLVLDTTSGTVTGVNADLHTFTVTATARDGVGNLVPDGTNVYWELVDPAPANGAAPGVLDAGSSTTTGGRASVTVTTTSLVGDDYRVRAHNLADFEESTVRGSSGKYVIRPGALDHFTVTGTPETVVAGVGFPASVTVKAYDQFSNLKTDFAGAVTFTTPGASSTVPTGVTFVASDLGQKTFPGSEFAIYTAGEQSLVATSATGKTGESGAITALPAALDHVTFTAAPDATDADTPAQFAAQPRDAFENLRDDEVGFSVTGSGAIDAATGVFTPELVGTTLVTATAGTKSVTEPIDVTVGLLHHVTFTASPSTTDADTPATFIAEARDQNENVRSDTVSYELTGSGALGAATGVFTPALVGTHTVTATAGDKTTSADITVTVGALDHVTFTQAPTTTDADTPATFVAEARDQHDNVRADVVTYALTGSGAVGAASGIFTPSLVGTSIVTATVGEKSAPASIEVSVGELHHVTFTAAPATTDADTGVVFAAEPRDQHDNLRTDAIAFSVTGSGAIDAQTGLYTPELVGTSTVKATAGLVEQTTNILVTVGALDHLTFVAAPATTDADTTQAFTAEPRDQFENARTDVVVYEITGGSGAIDPDTGVFTPQLVGSTTIRATSGAKEASTSILVDVGALDHVTFTAFPAATDADTPQTFTAEPRDQHDNLRADAIAYAIQSGSGAVDAATGVFTPQLVGTTIIRATAGEKTETTPIVVDVGALDHVTFTASPATTDADTAALFVAEARDQHDNTLADAVAYALDGSGAIGGASGLFTPQLVGTHTVTATAGDKTTSTDIEVTVGALDHVTFTAAPTTTDADTPAVFVAEARDQHENLRTDVIAYSDAGSGAIDAATGVFTPQLVGTTTITAAAGTVEESTSILVDVGTLHHVTFVLAPATTTADNAQTFAAEPRDQHDNLRADEIVYSLVGSGSIDASTGLFTPHSVGTTTVVAAAGAVSTSTDIAVSVGALDHVSFTTAPGTTDADTTVDFVAEARDQHDNVRTDEVAYSVLSGSGTIDPVTGSFVPSHVGTTVVKAVAGEEESTASILVTVGALHHVTFTTSPAATDADTPQTFVAEPRDQRDNLRTDAVTYAISSGSGAIEGATGVFTPQLVGTTSVEATAGDKLATATIEVTPGELHHLTFTVAPATTNADSVQRFTAEARDQFENVRTDAIVYSLGAGATGAIDGASGLFTPDLVGTVTVTAASGLVTRSTDITVTPGAPVALAFTAAPSTAVAGEAQDATVEIRDANGNHVTDATHAVTLAPTSAPAGGELSGTATVTAIGGTATFAGLSFNKVGEYAVGATATGLSSTSTTTAVTVAALDHYDVSCDASVQAGGSVTCAASAFDAFDNPRGDAPTSWTATAGGFPVTSGATVTYIPPTTRGTYTVTAATGAANGADTVTVTPGPLATITLNTASNGAIVPVSADTAQFTVTATARDGYNNLVADGTTIYWTLIDSGTANAASSGLATTSGVTANGVVSVVVTTSTRADDDYRVRAQDAQDEFDASVIKTSAKHVVGAGALHHFTVTGTPGSATAGTAFSAPVTVKAMDQFDNVKPAFTGAIHFTSTDGAAVLPSDYTFLASENGIHAFAGAEFTLNTVGTQTLSASLTTDETKTGGSAAIDVVAAP